MTKTLSRKRLQKALDKEGHGVETFASGEDFLEELAAAPFDLVFLDVILPGIGGMEVLRRIKSPVPRDRSHPDYRPRLPERGH